MNDKTQIKIKNSRLRVSLILASEGTSDSVTGTYVLFRRREPCSTSHASFYFSASGSAWPVIMWSGLYCRLVSLSISLWISTLSLLISFGESTYKESFCEVGMRSCGTGCTLFWLVLRLELRVSDFVIWSTNQIQHRHLAPHPLKMFSYLFLLTIVASATGVVIFTKYFGCVYTKSAYILGFGNFAL